MFTATGAREKKMSRVTGTDRDVFIDNKIIDKKSSHRGNRDRAAYACFRNRTRNMDFNKNAAFLDKIAKAELADLADTKATIHKKAKDSGVSNFKLAK